MDNLDILKQLLEGVEIKQNGRGVVVQYRMPAAKLFGITVFIVLAITAGGFYALQQTSAGLDANRVAIHELTGKFENFLENTRDWRSDSEADRRDHELRLRQLEHGSTH